MRGFRPITYGLCNRGSLGTDIEFAARIWFPRHRWRRHSDSVSLLVDRLGFAEPGRRLADSKVAFLAPAPLHHCTTTNSDVSG